MSSISNFFKERAGILSDHDKTLTQYIDELKSDDQKIRIKAAIALGEWGNDRAVTPLIHSLIHENDDFRREAARALKEIGNRRAVEPLIELLLNDNSPEIRAEVAYCLGYFKDAKEEVDALISSLEDEHYLVRQNVAFALGKIKRRKATSPLIDVLKKDENYNVREIAAWALGELNDKRATPQLIIALNDQKVEVRRNAAYSLGRLEDQSAIEPLMNQLLRVGETKEPAWAITKILKKRQAVKILKDTFKRKKKDKLIEDCIDICRVLIDVDRNSANNMISELLNEQEFSQYHSELKSII